MHYTCTWFKKLGGGGGGGGHFPLNYHGLEFDHLALQSEQLLGAF